jgi:hypothetical protein
MIKILMFVIAAILWMTVCIGFVAAKNPCYFVVVNGKTIMCCDHGTGQVICQ